ncbi:hypothetical protein ACKVMT_11600 [Halobacteriales archaeon Cl-PHB]
MSGESAANRPEYGDAWVYESIIGAIPGLALPPRVALAVQFVGFEGAVLALAVLYDRWEAVPAGTAAVVVTTVGSAFMLWIAETVRESDVPDRYRRLLFGSSIEVVLAVLAFVAFLTYLLVGGEAGEPGPLAAVLGPDPPAPAVFLALLLAWDVCYRIGTGWWASLVGLWRTLSCPLDGPTRRRLRQADLATLGFAGVQLLLVPVLVSEAVLALAVAGHVGAVTVVSGASAVLLARQN